jgi:hypothetical protein
LAAPYSDWLAQARVFVARLSESEQKLILGDVARMFYGLQDQS